MGKYGDIGKRQNEDKQIASYKSFDESSQVSIKSYCRNKNKI